MAIEAPAEHPIVSGLPRYVQADCFDLSYANSSVIDESSCTPCFRSMTRTYPNKMKNPSTCADPSRRKCDVVIFVFRAFGRLKKPPGAGQLYNIKKEKERVLASVA